jgi:hypothetical protein
MRQVHAMLPRRATAHLRCVPLTPVCHRALWYVDSVLVGMCRASLQSLVCVSVAHPPARAMSPSCAAARQRRVLPTRTRSLRRHGERVRRVMRVDCVCART